MLNTTKTNSASKQIRFVAFHDWMIEMPVNSLELYIYGGLFGITEMNGAWKGSIEKLVYFLKLTNYSDTEIESSINRLSDLDLITVKEWTYPNSYEITAKKYCISNSVVNGGQKDE